MNLKYSPSLDETFNQYKLDIQSKEKKRIDRLFPNLCILSTSQWVAPMSRAHVEILKVTTERRRITKAAAGFQGCSTSPPTPRFVVALIYENVTGTKQSFAVWRLLSSRSLSEATLLLFSDFLTFMNSAAKLAHRLAPLLLARQRLTDCLTGDNQPLFTVPN